MDSDSGITGIVIKVSIREPAVREQWWAMSDDKVPDITILYKVRLFRDTIKDIHYREHQLTMLSTGERQLGDKVGYCGVQWDVVEVTDKGYK